MQCGQFPACQIYYTCSIYLQVSYRWIKLHRPCSGQSLMWVFLALRGKKLQSEESDLARIELVQDFMSVQVTCNFHKDPIKSKQDMCRTRSHMGASNSKVNSPIWPEFELIREFMPVQITCKFDKLSIKTRQAMCWTRSNMGFFGTKGQVTPMWIVRSGQNSNSPKILWLSSLLAGLKMIQSKVKVLSSPLCLWEKFSSLKGK